MQVDPTRSVTLAPNHSIEVGRATWNQSETSIRNRYDQANGRINVRASSELPLPDLEPVMQAAAQNDLLDCATCARIIQAFAASIERRARAAGI